MEGEKKYNPKQITSEDYEYFHKQRDEHFKKIFEGNFEISKHEESLYKLAKQYQEECEEFDLNKCTGRNEKGVAIPVNRHELASINIHAHKVLQRLLTENPGIEIRDLIKAMHRYNK